MVKEFIAKSKEEWRRHLTSEQYEVCRKKDIERPFSGEFNHCKEKGVYHCICCENELFSSETKFDSGTGWPSFGNPINQENIVSETDSSYGMIRVEIMCSKCEAHLGHVFDDGPAPTNLRHCINSISLKLAKKD